MLPSFPLSFYLFFILILILALSFYFGRDAVIRRALRKARRCDIGSAPEASFTKLVGALSFAEEPLIAPLTGRRCAYYEAIVEELRGGRNSRWVRVIHEVGRRDFYLDDGTGRALVRTSGAEVVVTRDSHQRSGTFRDATPELESFLRKHGRESTGVLGFNKSLRYREGVLEEGEHVAVCGVGRRAPDPWGQPGGYREQPTMLVLEPQEKVPLYVSDDPSTTRG